MKKLTVLTALLILVSILNPTFGQWGRSRKTITTKDTGDKEVVIPLREPEKVITPETTSSKALTVADLLVRFEKLEQRQTSSEKSIISIKKEQKKEKKSMLDSILALSNAHKKSSSALQLNLNNLSAEIKKGISEQHKLYGCSKESSR